MSDPIILPAVDFPDVIREGCALVLLGPVCDTRGRIRPTGTPLTCSEVLPTGVLSDIDVEPIPLTLVAVDLTRPSGQWAVACWVCARPGRAWLRDTSVVSAALTGEADPAELRHLALGVRGG